MYKVVWALSNNPVHAAKAVEEQVNFFEQEGWTSQGGISFVKDGGFFAFQTIVKKDE